MQILNPGHNSHGHLAPVGRWFWAGVKSGTEALANLLDARLQLVSLEEDNEHRLVDLVGLQIIKG